MIPDPHLAWLPGTQPVCVPSRPTKFSVARLFSSVLCKLPLMLWMCLSHLHAVVFSVGTARIAAPTDRASPRRSALLPTIEAVLLNRGAIWLPGRHTLICGVGENTHRRCWQPVSRLNTLQRGGPPQGPHPVPTVRRLGNLAPK